MVGISLDGKNIYDSAAHASTIEVVVLLRAMFSVFNGTDMFALSSLLSGLMFDFLDLACKLNLFPALVMSGATAVKFSVFLIG